QLAARNRPANPALLLQIGQLYRLLGEYELALAAFDEALPVTNSAVPEWNIQFQRAQVLAEMGDREAAITLATSLLTEVPPQVVDQVQLFIDDLAAGEE
ncbi:MAG: hypothetical protein KDE09_17520, partial [Anaerolineales bacterium]|nr:hypothetical protein [Anaerolineales bacterium]